MTRVIVFAAISSLAVGGIAVVACQSDAETPDAYFGVDAGQPGDVGQPCRANNACNAIDLLCIEDPPDPTATCRLRCDVSQNDPCGAGFLCVAVQNQGNTGACLPAPGDGEPCTNRCDDGLTCVNDVCEAAGEGEGEGE